MKTNKYNLNEATKWKKLARQGKLSQKDFDTLKTSSVGKKYLNPRQIMKNKAKGQDAELKKLLKKTGWSLDIVRGKDHDAATEVDRNNKHIKINLGPTPANYRKIGYSHFEKPTALQRAITMAHEKDEAIQALKSKVYTGGNNYHEKEAKIAALYYDNKPFKLTKSQQKDSKNIEKQLRKVKKDKHIKSLSLDAAHSFNGYGHVPGVLNKEFELRNLLYPSYRKSPNKKLQSFNKGKYTWDRYLFGFLKSDRERLRQFNKDTKNDTISEVKSKLKQMDAWEKPGMSADGWARKSDEIEYGKMPKRKQEQMLKHNTRILSNQMIWNKLKWLPLSKKRIKKMIQKDT